MLLGTFSLLQKAKYWLNDYYFLCWPHQWTAVLWSFLFDQINGNQTWVGYIWCIPYAVVTNICWMFVLLKITIYHFPFRYLYIFLFPYTHIAFPLFSCFWFGECWCQQNRIEIDGFRIPAVPFYYITCISSTPVNETKV